MSSKSSFIIRSVDSLQKIYAVIVALAISVAIQSLFISTPDGRFVLNIDIVAHLPVFFSLLVVIVPFYHGMNRHLDICYIERPLEQTVKGALLFDFFVFFLESAVLFAVAASIRAGLHAFTLLGTLLLGDLIWAVFAHWIHYRKFTPSVINWAAINFITLVISIFIFHTSAFPEHTKVWLFLVVAIARSVADYWKCWQFYFPESEEAAA